MGSRQLPLGASGSEGVGGAVDDVHVSSPDLFSGSVRPVCYGGQKFIR